jgi:Cu(I)/Ag(I) efflux system periplasmic protein CusF
MKKIAIVFALAIAAPSTLLGMDMKDHKSMDMKNMDGMKMDGKSMPTGEKGRTTHKTTGVVKSVDAKKGSATLAHDPVPSLKWPSMTMSFAVKDKTMLDKLQPGKKVEFEFVQQGKDNVITSVK